MSATDLDKWVGRSETRADLIAPAPAVALAATLDLDPASIGEGRPLPPLWHWLYFHAPVASGQLGRDGHPARGGFMPPVELPRRMWAGGRLSFHAPLRVGERARRQSTIASVQRKRGRSGELVFVRVDHRIFRDDQLLIEEQQDVVYREAGAAQPSAGSPAPGGARFSRVLTPDPVLLFRYSALTFNAHRIHYDRDYAVHEEGYGALVVQGPLTATLLLDLLARELPGAGVSGFEFRGLRPILDNGAVTLQGRREDESVHLWALDGAGALAMEARAQLAG